MSPPSSRVGAVILAAGFGTRLAPLTDHTPKPLLEVGHRPVASHLVDRLGAVGSLSQVVVVVNGRHIDRWNRWAETVDSTPRPQIVSNNVVDEPDRPGAVADMQRGISEIAGVDWIIVLAGDNLIEESLQAHVDAAATSRKPVVLCRDLGTDVPAGRFGEITIDMDGRITRFREKPSDPTSPLAATCSYVLPGDIGASIDSYLGSGDADSPGSFIGWLAQKRPVLARVLTGRYFDIGNHETLATARSAYS